MDQFHLAQINIARARAPRDSDVMTGFVDRLDEINAMADMSPGFVWRLEDDDDETVINVFGDPSMLINMSVWEDIESLKNFVYRTVHVELIRDRDAWFNKMLDVHQVLWWIPAGHTPSIQEGKQKLEQLQEHGPGELAFTFARPFGPNAKTAKSPV